MRNPEHTTTCAIPTCGSPAIKRGWCSAHYQRWRKHGSPYILKQPQKQTVATFWLNVEWTPTCWLWCGCKSADGYGRIRWDGRTRSVHRTAYELLVAPIPDGMVIDHLCRVRHCVNPEHLQLVLPAVNTLRGIVSPDGQFYDAELYPCGHPRTTENTRRGKSGMTRCRTCFNAYHAAWAREDRRKKAGAHAAA